MFLLKNRTSLVFTLFIGLLALYPSGYIANATTFLNPHGNYVSDTNMCDKCHSGHGGFSGGILDDITQRQTCYSCHDGSKSNFNAQAQFGENIVGSSVYTSFHPVPTGQQLCTTCHDPHYDPGTNPRLLAVGPQVYSSGNEVCGSCHGPDSALPGGDMLTPFTATAHDVEMSAPSSGTDIKCARCHGPHGSPYKDIIRSVIEDAYGTARTVTGNDNSVCFGCHTDSTGNYFGKSVYEQTKHGPGTTTINDTTQAQFTAGTLTSVAAIMSGDLTLSGDRGVRFDGVDDSITLPANYTSVQNTFTYEFWVRPQATHEIDIESTSGFAGTAGQKYAIGAQSGGDGPGAGVGVSVGTNGIGIYEHANSYMPALLVYPTTINNWVHVAVVYNNKTPSLYVNGEFKRTGFTSPRTPFPSNTFGYGSYGYFNGSMDDIRIWNYARSQTQIKNDMYKELAGSETGLIGYWKLNESSGSAANDSAGTNHGTIWGAVRNQYATGGNRLSPEFSLPNAMAHGSQVAWNSTVPSSTSMTVETDVFIGGTWQGWQPVTNGGPIPGISNGTNMSGGKIRYQVNLATTNPVFSPVLHEVSLRITNNSTISKSTYPGLTYLGSECMNCHEPHGKTGESFYRRADGNTLCTNCHDEGSVVRPPTYSYRGITAYNATPHGSMGPIPNPTLYTNPDMPSGYCVICHNPHGKNDGTGKAIPKQLQLAQEQLCFGGGSGCHSDPANSTLGVNIQNRFTVGTNTTSRHSVAANEQTADNTKVQCTNCHNPHLNDRTNKLIDPANPATVYTGFDTSLLNYISETGEVYMLAKARHDGVAPTFVTGPSVGSMTDTSCIVSWSNNEVSTGVIEWREKDGSARTPLNSSAKTSHSVTLSSLTLFKNYYYSVKATDAIGNFYQTPEVLVDPNPPLISNGPSPANPKSGGMDIVWTTDEVSTSWVDYNLSVNYAVYGFVYTKGNDTLTTAHSVYLDNLSLEPGAEYNYQVRSKDRRGNETTSPVKTFKFSTPPPATTLIPEEDHLNYLYYTTATLYWNAVTDPDGDSVEYYVEISPTSNFSSGVQNSGWISGTNWNVQIGNNEQVIWYWRVKVRDQWGFQSAWSPVDDFVHEGYYEPVYSCPILYTWNGEKFEFVTDIVAGSNVGLQMSPGKYLAPDPDEQLAIPGNLLQEKDGLYTLKLKNERHEIDYIDNLVLQAVDHPVGTKVTLNDFVRAKEPFQIYTYGTNIKPVQKATYVNNPTYSGGRATAPVDVTELVSKIDNRHAIGSLFDDHQFTFDLGNLSNADEIKLVVTGWTKFATADERAERVEKAAKGIKTAPRLLEILQPDGSWKAEEIKHIPGYTKTALIDLTGKFPEDTRQFVVRLRGLYRPYLDFVGVDITPQAETKVTDLKLVNARLEYRGTSYYSASPVPRHEYDILTNDSLRHEGRFTKFGDVMPLMEAVDDLLVVMDTGDELTVSFEALPPPAPGMTRSFVLKPWAYYKELEAAKVDPMPFRDMSFHDYPKSLGDYPTELQDYVEEWNTRIHYPDGVEQDSLFQKLKAFLLEVVQTMKKGWNTVFIGEENGGELASSMGEVKENPGDSLIIFEKDHYSLNTDFVALRTDDTVNTGEYTMDSLGSGMWDSDSEPNPSSPGTDKIASKAAVTTSNNVRWATEKYLANQGEGQFNYQMFKFVITEPKNKLYSLKVLWEGYGEPTAGYPVTLSLWNFNTSTWDQFHSRQINSETTLTLEKTKDYRNYCYKCHGGSVPSGVQLGPYNKNIASIHANDYHGGLTGYDDSGSTLKPAYSRGMNVACIDCHDLHGSQNAYHLRENLNGSTNVSVPSMATTSIYDTSKNNAIEAYCKSCHLGTRDTFHMAKCLYCHRDPGVHDCNPPAAGDFSRACTYCHTHGGYMPAHGMCHCTLDYNAKAF